MSIEEEIYDKLVEQFGIGDVCIKKYRKRASKTWLEFISLCLSIESADDLRQHCGFATTDSFSKYFLREFSSIMTSKAGRLWKTYLYNIIGRKKCKTCATLKSFIDYRHDSAQYDGLTNSCKTCLGIKDHNNYTLNKDKKTSNDKKYRLANKEKIKNRSRIYYIANRKRLIAKAALYRSLNRDKISFYNKKYKITHYAEFKAYNAKYRASKLKATPKWADLEKIKIIYRECPTGYHVDHIVPLQHPLVCGLHCEFNLQHLTAEENLRKSNKFEV